MVWWLDVIIKFIIGFPAMIIVVGGVCLGMAWLMILYTEHKQKKIDSGKPLNKFDKFIEKISNIILK